MNKLETFLASVSMLAVSALLPEYSFAQQATPVTPTATPNATASLFGPSNGVTACNTTAQTSAQAAVTITPGSNQFVYVTGVYVDITSDVTGGAANVVTASFSNMLGAPVYSLGTLTAAQSIGGSGVFRQIAEVYNPPMKSQTAGTAVAWTPSAAIPSHNIVCPRIAAYIAQ